MFQEIYVIDNQEDFTESLKELFVKDTNFKLINVKETQINNIFQNIPEIIVVNEDNINTPTIEICKTIRKNEDNNITPLIISSSNEEKQHKLELAKASVEYYIPKSMGTEYLYYRIKNMSRLLAVNRTVSPLTGLPGNVQIQKELKKRLLKQESFSVLYLDLDNFKAYNDVYGFLQGDEIIKFTARTIVKNVNVKNSSDIFIRTYWWRRFCCNFKYRNRL
jgi:PleD family two-component response regulator